MTESLPLILTLLKVGAAARSGREASGAAWRGRLGGRGSARRRGRGGASGRRGGSGGGRRSSGGGQASAPRWAWPARSVGSRSRLPQAASDRQSGCGQPKPQHRAAGEAARELGPEQNPGTIAHATSPRNSSTVRVDDQSALAQRSVAVAAAHVRLGPGTARGSDGTNVFVYLSMLPLAQTHTRSAVQPSDDIRRRRSALRLRNVRDDMIPQPGGIPCALSARPGTVSRAGRPSRRSRDRTTASDGHQR